MTLIKCLHAAS